MKFNWPTDIKPTDHPSVLFRDVPPPTAAEPVSETWQVLKQTEEQAHQRRIARQAVRREALRLIQQRAIALQTPTQELLEWLREQLP